jgi:hypothetical protein
MVSYDVRVPSQYHRLTRLIVARCEIADWEGEMTLSTRRYLPQFAGRQIEDKSANYHFRGDPRVRLELQYLLLCRLVDVGIAMKFGRGYYP